MELSKVFSLVSLVEKHRNSTFQVHFLVKEITITVFIYNILDDGFLKSATRGISWNLCTRVAGFLVLLSAYYAAQYKKLRQP